MCPIHDEWAIVEFCLPSSQRSLGSGYISPVSPFYRTFMYICTTKMKNSYPIQRKRKKKYPKNREIALFHLYMCVKQFTWNVMEKHSCAFYVYMAYGIRKFFSFLLLSFLFMACLYFVFSKVFPSILQAKWKKAFFSFWKIRRCQWKGKNTPKWYMKYTHIVSESLKMYTLLFYFFFLFVLSICPPISLSIHPQEPHLLSFLSEHTWISNKKRYQFVILYTMCDT